MSRDHLTDCGPGADRPPPENSREVQALLASVEPLTDLLQAHLAQTNRTTEAATLAILQRLTRVESETAQLLTVLQQGHAATLYEEAQRQLREHRQQLDEMDRYSRQREQQIRDDSAEIRNLSERVAALNPMTTLIREVTVQTNMLGLNAAIQAASAGEVGEGFAVVASMMRALSAQVKAAVGRIEADMASVASAVQQRLIATEQARQRAEAESQWLATMTGSMTRLSENFQTAVGELNRLSRHTLHAVRSIRAVVLEALQYTQFQDITRQQIEQVQDSLARCGRVLQNAAQQLEHPQDEPFDETALDEVAAGLRTSYTMQSQHRVHDRMEGTAVAAEKEGPRIELF